VIQPLADRLRLHLDADEVRREDLLQVFMLGAALVSKDLRDTLNPEDFTEIDMQCAVSELKEGGSYKYLRGVLRELVGVEWVDSDGPPLPKITARLKQNGKRAGVLDMLVQAMRALEGKRTDEDIERFFEACIEAGRRSVALPDDAADHKRMEIENGIVRDSCKPAS